MHQQKAKRRLKALMHKIDKNCVRFNELLWLKDLPNILGICNYF